MRALRFFILLGLLVVAACGTKTSPASGPDLFKEVWDIVQKEYADPQAWDEAKLSQGAIRGLLEALNDPHTAYLEKEQYNLWQASFESSFEGIGAMVSLKEGRFVVIASLAGSPAEKAGLQPDDWIQVVNGTPTQGLSLTEAVLLIRGPQGTSVTLTVLHPGATEPVEISLIREKIELKSVFWEMKEDLAFVRVSSFVQDTERELKAALEEAQRLGARGLILDLRHNPGGLLDAAVGVASQFLEEGVVLYQGDREEGRMPIKVRPGGVATQLPLVVLVDEASASGSEVVAGALRDHGRAILIGTTTFGKGSINEAWRLSDGSGLILTTARWYTPQGHLIEGQGLAPDIESIRTPEDVASGQDPPRDKAIEYLRTLLQ